MGKNKSHKIPQSSSASYTQRNLKEKGFLEEKRIRILNNKKLIKKNKERRKFELNFILNKNSTGSDKFVNFYSKYHKFYTQKSEIS